MHNEQESSSAWWFEHRKMDENGPFIEDKHDLVGGLEYGWIMTFHSIGNWECHHPN